MPAVAHGDELHTRDGLREKALADISSWSLQFTGPSLQNAMIAVLRGTRRQHDIAEIHLVAAAHLRRARQVEQIPRVPPQRPCELACLSHTELWGAKLAISVAVRIRTPHRRNDQSI
ncbi:MAG: hypothetical protein K2Y37_10680 [Pirellulales bacterium]|nr:hypothetical protein [Pirellulales bacterium]